jgi:hypothetical protein
MVAARTPNLRASGTTRGSAARPKPRSPTAAKAGTRAKAKAPVRSKGWSAKLRPELEAQVVADPRHGGRLLLPTPLLLAEEIAAVPRGGTLTVSQLRTRLAHRMGADRTCPLMTGLFIKILAGVVADDLAQRRRPRWPVWRLVADNGRLVTTWPLDALYRATRLREEGVRLGHRNHAWQVLDPRVAP